MCALQQHCPRRLALCLDVAVGQASLLEWLAALAPTAWMVQVPGAYGQPGVYSTYFELKDAVHAGPALSRLQSAAADAVHGCFPAHQRALQACNQRHSRRCAQSPCSCLTACFGRRATFAGPLPELLLLLEIMCFPEF